MSYDAPMAYAPVPIYVYVDERAIQARRYTAVSPTFDVVVSGRTTNAARGKLVRILQKAGMPKKQKTEIIALKDAKELERVWKTNKWGSYK